MAVPENINLIADLFQSAVVVPGIIDRKRISLISQVAVGYDHSFIGKGSLRALRHTVTQFISLKAGIDKIVPAADFADTGSLKKRMLLIIRSLCRIKTIGNALRLADDRMHIVS